MEEHPLVIGVDPGRSKCGLAVLSPDGQVLERAILSVSDTCARVIQVCTERHAVVVVGRGTGSDAVVERLQQAGCTPELVDEAGTSALARRRYLLEHPERGWRKWIPLGLRYPREPYDDYVALILAERHLRVVGSTAELDT